MEKLLGRLKDKETLVSDGAMGTSLQAAGLGPGQAPEEWNIANPSAVLKVHNGFILAGCDMITTNTFGANLIKLKRTGIEAKFTEVNTAAAALARQAAVGSVYVLGDIGPTGEFLRPVGIYEDEEFYNAFFKQAVILSRGGVDAFIIETMSDLGELKAAVSACKKAADLPIIASMTFIQGQKGFRTMMGVSIEDGVSGMLRAGCNIIGANCGCGTLQMLEIMNQMKEAKKTEDVFLIAQPNAGMPKLIQGKTVFNETPEDFAISVKKLIDLGVNIIGGCCGTTPEHIREIAKIVKTPPR